MLKGLFAIVVIAAPALMSPAVAQDAPSNQGSQSAPNHNVGDRDERICEKITPVGSRLTTKRFCGTRAEWAEKRRLDREEVEKVQRGPCVRHAGC
ncbi:MAG TPA: hypothetical protein VFZ88_08305 [Sphingomicrobium sp.]|jgi:hypothetical protein